MLSLLTPLDADTLRAHGVPAPFRIGQADRVRFRELDVLDHVNNAVYLGWFETFRIAYFRATGLSAYDGRADRPIFVLKQVGVDFLAPLHLEDVYIVAGRVRAYRRTSFTMEYGVWSNGQRHAAGHAIICLMEPDGKARQPLPDGYLEVFRADGADAEG